MTSLDGATQVQGERKKTSSRAQSPLRAALDTPYIRHQGIHHTESLQTSNEGSSKGAPWP